MSFFGRIFGGKPKAAPTSVVIDPELAATLTADGAGLDVAVDTALRAQLEAQAKAAAAGEPERMPFWLQRDSDRSAELEDQLRDRVIQRHESEDDARR